jgi:hypothetical protein
VKRLLALAAAALLALGVVATAGAKSKSAADGRRPDGLGPVVVN